MKQAQHDSELQMCVWLKQYAQREACTTGVYSAAVGLRSE